MWYIEKLVYLVHILFIDVLVPTSIIYQNAKILLSKNEKHLINFKN